MQPPLSASHARESRLSPRPPPKRTPMLNLRSKLLLLSVTKLALLLCACTNTPKSLPPVLNPATGVAVQVPKTETPALCLPTCTAGLTKLRQSLLNTQTGSESKTKPSEPPKKP